MSYDIRVCVKVEGCDEYAVVGRPEYDSPTYNLIRMFRACMDWDYAQGEHYPAAYALDRLDHGIQELTRHPDRYQQYVPDNGWGSIASALRAMRSARECILECAEDVPIGCLYMRW